MKLNFQGLNLTRALESIREVIANPTANLTAALLLLGVVSLVLLVIVVALLLVLAGGADDDDEDDDDEFSESSAEEVVESPADEVAPVAAPPTAAQLRMRRAAALLGVVLVPLIVVVALVSGYVLSSQSSYCLSCHRTVASVASADGSVASRNPHSKIACVTCHEERGALAIPGNGILRLRDLVAAVSRTRISDTVSVPSERCAPCHKAPLAGVLVDKKSGLKMSHKAPLAAGMACSDCHQGAGHATVVSAGMPVCLRCHDGVKASAACTTCHIGDPGAATADKRLIPAVNLPPVSNCGGCHNQVACDQCHGLRMPHTAVFRAYDHERYAGFGKKTLCYRCHTPGFCSKCHLIKNGTWGHGSGNIWLQQHAEFKRASAGCGCHNDSPYAAAGHFCDACHAVGSVP